MKLRTKRSHIHTLPEGTAPKKMLPTLTRYLYFLLLLAIAAGTAYVITMKYLYFKGRGRVEVSRLVLSSTHGGRVERIDVTKGESINSGDVLAIIDKGTGCFETENDIRLTRLSFEIQAQEAQLEVYTEQLRRLGAQSQPVGIVSRALEIGDADNRRRHEQLRVEQHQLRRRIDLLAANIAVKQLELVALERELDRAPSTACDFETITAPVNGTLLYATRKMDEYIHQGDPFLVIIPEGGEVFIDGYIANRDFNNIEVGERMEIVFPDKTTSWGTVRPLISSAHTASERWRNQNDYQPAETMLKARLVPSGGEAETWKRYDRMDVTIRGRRR